MRRRHDFRWYLSRGHSFNEPSAPFGQYAGRIMHCFCHQSVEAVGACKNCGRGLCPTCAVDVDNGLACRARCEEEVRSLNRVIARNKTAYVKTGGAYARMALFYGLLGALLLAGALANWRGVGWMLWPAGIVCLASALLHLLTGRRFERD